MKKAQTQKRKEKRSIIRKIRAVAEGIATEEDVNGLCDQYGGLFCQFTKKYFFILSFDDLMQECRLTLVKACKAYNESCRFFCLLKTCLVNHFSHLVEAYYRPCRHPQKALLNRMSKNGVEITNAVERSVMYTNLKMRLSDTDLGRASGVAFGASSFQKDPCDLESLHDTIGQIEGMLSQFETRVFREFVVPGESTLRMSGSKDGKVGVDDVAIALGVRRSEVTKAMKSIRPVVSNLVRGG